MKYLLLVLFSLSTNAAVVKNDVTGLKRESFALKEACTKAGFEHLLLVEAKNATTIDCMGRDLNALDFCKKVKGSGSLLRGFVSQSKSQVYCEYGETVSLSIVCDQKHYQYCQNAERGCEQLRPVFADELKLMHSSLTGAPTNLNCHYSVSELSLPSDL